MIWHKNNLLAHILAELSPLLPGGYPDPPGKYPASAQGLSAKDCVTFEGLDEAMCYAFKSDNQGPPASMAVTLTY